MEPGTYKKLQIKAFPARAQRETAEGKYWRAFKAPTVISQHGVVSHIDFIQDEPHHFAATAATRVLMYDASTQKLRKQFTRFKDITYSGCFRQDGKVLAAGGESSLVRLFDVQSRSMLRQLEGHTRAIRAVRFADDKTHVISGADDATIRWWDIATGVQVRRLDGHSDYVRALAGSPAGSEVWASGSYDHSVRVWDVRSAECAMKLDHGAPVEDIAWFPSAGLLATAGGPVVCIWDMLTGRRLRRLTNHQKTVTCVQVVADIGPPSAEDDHGGGAATRMFTGSLDGHMKVFDCNDFQVTHVSKYPGPITALGIAPDCSVLAVGTGNGLLSIRKRSKPRAAMLSGGGGRSDASKNRELHRPPRLQTGAYRYFMRGKGARAGSGDFKVAAQRRARLAPFDKKLRQFKVGEALDAALLTRMPEVVVTVIEELMARGGLEAAVSGRNAETLVPVLEFLAKYVAEPRYSRLLAGVTERMLDVYGSVVGQSPQVDAKLQLLRERVVVEVRLQQELLMLQGSLEPILTAALA